MQLLQMGREYFHSLLTSPYPIYHKLYADAPALLATVTPADLADFVVVSFFKHTFQDLSVVFLFEMEVKMNSLNECICFSSGAHLTRPPASPVSHSIPLSPSPICERQSIPRDSLAFSRRFPTAGEHKFHFFQCVFISMCIYLQNYSMDSLAGIEPPTPCIKPLGWNSFVTEMR